MASSIVIVASSVVIVGRSRINIFFIGQHHSVTHATKTNALTFTPTNHGALIRDDSESSTVKASVTNAANTDAKNCSVLR